MCVCDKLERIKSDIVVDMYSDDERWPPFRLFHGYPLNINEHFYFLAGKNREEEEKDEEEAEMEEGSMVDLLVNCVL